MDKFLLCTMAKLENRYLGEWITHHLNIGFDKIVIIDNNDTVGDLAENIYEVPEVQNGIKSNIIDIYPLNNGRHLQQVYFQKVFEQYKEKYTWFMYLDVDEFLHLENHILISDYILQDKFKDFNAIRFNWKCFGGCDIIDDGRYDVGRFTVPSNSNQDSCCKTLFKYVDDELIFPTSHGPLSLHIKSCNVDGIEVLPQAVKCIKSHSDAWVNHYTTKSLKEYLSTKILRGGSAQSINTLNKKYALNYFWTFNNCTPKHRKYIRYFASKYNRPDLLDETDNILHIFDINETIDPSNDYIVIDSNYFDNNLHASLRVKGKHTLYKKDGSKITNVYYSIKDLLEIYDYVICSNKWFNLNEIITNEYSQTI